MTQKRHARCVLLKDGGGWWGGVSAGRYSERRLVAELLDRGLDASRRDDVPSGLDDVLDALLTGGHIHGLRGHRRGRRARRSEKPSGSAKASQLAASAKAAAAARARGSPTASRRAPNSSGKKQHGRIGAAGPAVRCGGRTLATESVHYPPATLAPVSGGPGPAPSRFVARAGGLTAVAEWMSTTLSRVGGAERPVPGFAPKASSVDCWTQ